MARKKTFEEDKARMVRDKVLEDIIEILNETAKAKKFGNLKREMLLRLAGTALPRVTELQGKDGGPITISQILNATEKRR